MSLGDVITAALAPTYGYIPTNELIIAWLQGTHSVTVNDLADAWHELFDNDTIAAGSLGDRMYAWFVAQGATGDSLQELMYDYFDNLTL